MREDIPHPPTPLADDGPPYTFAAGGKLFAVSKVGPVRIAKLRSEVCDGVIDDPAPLIRELKHSKPADILTFTQNLPHTEPQYRYYFEWDNLAVLEISTYDNWWNNQIYNDARRMVRKAQKKGIEVRVVEFSDELVAGIKGIWDETPIRQGRPYCHYGKDFETVKRENSTFLNRAEFIGAYLGDELVGFDKVFYNDNRVNHMEIISKIAHRDKATTNALQAKAVELATRRGMRYMIYAAYTYGKKGDDSLTDFKKRNGYRRVDIPRYFVPLTSRGRMALFLGLHRGYKEAMPAVVLRCLSKVRTRFGKLAAASLRKRASKERS